MAGVSVYVGSLTSPTATGDQSYTGIGFQPKAIIFLGDKQNATGWTTTYQTGISFTTAAAQNYGVSASNLSGTGRREQAYAASNAPYVNTTATGNCTGTSAYLAAVLKQFDADGFTLTWNTVQAAGYTIHYIALGGDLSNAKAISWTSKTGTGSQAVTGVGFKPECVIHIGHEYTAASNTTESAMQIGAMDSLGHQWAMYGGSYCSTSVSTRRVQLTDCCIVGTTHSASVTRKAAFTSMDDDGFTVNWSANVNATYVYSLCLKGGTYGGIVVGNFAKTTASAPCTQEITTGLATTNGLLFVTDSYTAASTAVQTSMRFTVGASDGTHHHLIALQDQAATTSHMGEYTANCLAVANNDAGTNEALATISSLAPPTVSWSTNDANTTQICFVAFGNGTTPAPYETGLSTKWDFNKSDSSDVSDPIGTKTLTNHGATSTASGFHDCYFYKLDGTNDYLNNAAMTALGDTFSIEIIHQPYADTGILAEWYTSAANSCHIGTISGNHLACYVHSDSDAANLYSYGDYPVGAVYHTVITYDKNAGTGNGHVYRNGVDGTSSPETIGALVPATAVQFDLGGFYRGTYAAHDVYLIRFYNNVVLTAAQALQNYNAEQWRYSSYLPPPSGEVNINAVTATATADALTPSINAGVNLTSVIAAATADALAPSILSGINITAAIAEAVAEALVPEISGGGVYVEVLAVPAEATADALTSSVSSGVNLTSATAAATADSIAPSISSGVNITGAISEATASALVPSISAGVNLTSIPAEATADALAPSISSGINITAVICEATADALTPSISSGVNILAVIAEATAEALVPEISAGGGGINIFAVPAEAAATVLTPSISSGINLTSVIASATADSIAPSISAGADITATIAAATADALTPLISSGFNITAVPCEVTAAALTPSINSGVNISAVVAAAIAEALPPVISAGGIEVFAVTAEAVADFLSPSVASGTNIIVPAAEATASLISPSLNVGVNIMAVAAEAVAEALVPSIGREITINLEGAIIAETELTGTVTTEEEGLVGTFITDCELGGLIPA